MTPEACDKSKDPFLETLSSLLTSPYSPTIRERAQITQEGLNTGEVTIVRSPLALNIQVTRGPSNTAFIFIPEDPSSLSPESVISTSFDVSAALQDLSGPRYLDEMDLKQQELSKLQPELPRTN